MHVTINSSVVQFSCSRKIYSCYHDWQFLQFSSNKRNIDIMVNDKFQPNGTVIITLNNTVKALFFPLVVTAYFFKQSWKNYAAYWTWVKEKYIVMIIIIFSNFIIPWNSIESLSLSEPFWIACCNAEAYTCCKKFFQCEKNEENENRLY